MKCISIQTCFPKRNFMNKTILYRKYHKRDHIINFVISEIFWYRYFQITLKMISERGAKSLGAPEKLLNYWQRAHKNKYSEDNPTGIINLGTAENRLVDHLVLQKIQDISFKNMDSSLLHLTNFQGNKDLCGTAAKFLNRYMNPAIQIKVEDIFVVNGTTSGLEALGFILGDPDDGFIVPAPSYSLYKAACKARPQMKILPVHFISAVGKHFNFDINKLEDRFSELKISGERPKGLLLSNPINPLGVSLSLEQLEILLEFCLHNSIHLICDEIYFLSVYDKQNEYRNVLSLPNITKYIDIVHVLYGFSKDFALAGFRCGFIISFNKKVQECLLETSLMTAVPNFAQYIAEQILQDEKWIDKFVEVNYKEMRLARENMLNEFTGYDIKYVSGSCGMFLAISFQSYLEDVSFKSEHKLFEQFFDNGIYITPGQPLDFKEPGWFRVVFAKELVLREGLKRIKQVLDHSKETINCKDSTTPRK